ncbi:MAG: hypothetical protein H6Q14_2430 [Bacteroidetes bacterium]|nr:hypothetical protein [Bacteroidota bacterium]
MRKISFEDWKNSMSFMIDDEFDNNFLHSKPSSKQDNHAELLRWFWLGWSSKRFTPDL